MPAGELKIGETLRLADGRTTRVTGMTPRAGQHTVYNLEVDSQHVYYVGNSGVLVHNTCDISLGLGEHLDEFTDSVRNTVNKPVEIFPFNSLTKPTDGPWDGVVRAMHSADNIHFNMQGMSKEVFQAWMKNGGHLSTPYMGGKGWTNRELYEILTNPELMAKTQFHNLIGSLDDWLVKP